MIEGNNNPGGFPETHPLPPRAEDISDNVQNRPIAEHDTVILPDQIDDEQPVGAFINMPGDDIAPPIDEAAFIDAEAAPDAEFMPPMSTTPDEGDAPTTAEPTRAYFTVSLEFIAYVALAAFALALRLVQLGMTVLSDAEAREALAVFRTLQPNQALGSPIATQPLMYAANTILMSILGTSSAAPRLATVLVSIGIILMPLLYRRWIGKVPALLMAGLLTVSPALLIASRSMAGAVWSIGLAGLLIWALGRYSEERRRPYALLAAVCSGFLLFGSEGAGFLVLIMAAVGLAFGLATSADSGRQVTGSLRDTIRGFPVIAGLIAAALALFLIGTVFLLRPAGAAAFGEVISRGLFGFLYRPPANPLAFALYTSLIYEPILWVFGAAGIWFTLRDEGSFLQRGAIGWLMAAIAAALIYPGAAADHSLWFTLPLAFLSTVAVERALSPVRDRFFDVPAWGPYLHAVGVVAALGIAGINLILIGRSVLVMQPSLTPNVEVSRVILTLLTAMLVVILFFLVGSIWGAKAAWRGLGIGLVVFLGMYSLASGWRASFFDIDDPREPWRPTPTAQSLSRLENDLKEVSLRASGMPYDMPLKAAWPDDGAVAWAIRNFKDITFVDGPSVAFTGPAILLPRTSTDIKAEKPTLGGAYVGTDYAVTFGFDRSTIQYWDVLSWIYARDTRTQPTSSVRIALWVRADVYGAQTLDSSSQ